MVRDLEFDVSEMSPTTYLTARVFGKPFTAIPVFLTRHFHHGSMVCNVATGVRGPSDLHGKTFGVRAYTVTTGVWGRGILESEYGVDLKRVHWVTDDEEHVTEFRAPANVSHVAPGKNLRDMLYAGEIHAAFTGAAGIGRVGAPTGNWQVDPNTQGFERPKGRDEIQPLIPDAERAQIEWYRRTGIWPFHALVVVKDSLLQQHPWLATELFDLFKAAKEAYLQRLHSQGASSPAEEETLAMETLVQGDPIPYGVRANRASLEAVTAWAYRQGLTPRKFALEELFAAGTLDLE